MEKSATTVQNVEFGSFYGMFLIAYQHYQKKPFDLVNNNALGADIATTLCNYFLKDDQFYDSSILSHKSQPNFDKGFLLIGAYGTGKTSVFRTFNQMSAYAIRDRIQIQLKDGSFRNLSELRLGFGFHTTNEIVKEYEGLKSSEEKQYFWNKYSSGTRYFDDLTTEHQASNFGKVELFKDLLELRYEKGAKTFISLNFHGETEEETLESIATRYGERIYDRIFEMFNILVLKGKSFRK